MVIKDRHEHIGKGHIGIEGFRFFLNDPRFFDVPFILETPKTNGDQGDIENLNALKSLIQSFEFP